MIIRRGWLSPLHILISGLIFFKITTILSIKKYQLKLEKNVKIRMFTIFENYSAIFNCFLLILKLTCFLCALMYPTFVCFYYKYYECDTKIEDWNENCLTTISKSN